MPSSSPTAPRIPRGARRSLQQSSPERLLLADFLTPERNSELNHREALRAAVEEHTRVRERALQVVELFEANEEILRLQEQQAREQERLEAERAIRAEEERLRVLRAKSVPKLPPEPEAPKAPQAAPVQTEQPASTPAPTAPAKELSNTPATAVNGTATPSSTTTPAQPANASVFGVPTPQTQASAAQPSPFDQAAVTQQPAGTASPFQQATPSIFSQISTQASNNTNNPFASPPTAPAVNGTSTPVPAPQPQKATAADRHTVIHQNLKQLRASLASQATSNLALKNIMGDMRREIRKSVGQLSLDKTANRKVMEKIVATLRIALENSVGSQLIDPNQFVLLPREPVEGATHNESQLPSLFLYLLNHFSKAILSQFVNECGANTKAADPIGVAAAHVFSDSAFHWRGQSLIDMFIAKFRVICPVLFGYRGSEKTQQGRERVGWKRKDGAWITEQEHMDHMTGLGAGYAAVALRDFAKSKKSNPWPPSRYWEAFSKIVNTPPSEISNTQCVVLKAMIEHTEKRFIGFYGNAGIAALRIALVEFPAIAPEKTSAVRSLEVHGQLLKRTVGLDLS